jgi:hypothetical protein
VVVVGYVWGCWVGLGCGFGLVCVIVHSVTYSRAMMPSVIRIVAVGW